TNRWNDDARVWITNPGSCAVVVVIPEVCRVHRGGSALVIIARVSPCFEMCVSDLEIPGVVFVWKVDFCEHEPADSAVASGLVFIWEDDKVGDRSPASIDIFDGESRHDHVAIESVRVGRDIDIWKVISWYILL